MPSLSRHVPKFSTSLHDPRPPSQHRLPATHPVARSAQTIQQPELHPAVTGSSKNEKGHSAPSACASAAQIRRYKTAPAAPTIAPWMA